VAFAAEKPLMANPLNLNQIMLAEEVGDEKF
jgi:hypothetical protein